VFDRAKWVFNRLATPIEHARALCQPGRHAVQHRFVLQTRDRAELASRAVRTEFAIIARQFVGVVGLLQTTQKRR